MNSLIGTKMFSRVLAKNKFNLIGTNYQSLFRFSSNFKDKELTEERIFIDKKEREIMKKLLSKLDTKEGKDGQQANPNYDSEDEEALGHVLERHGKTISTDLFKDLLKWKRGEN